MLVRMFLDYKDRFDTTVTNINKELTDLRNKFSKLKSDVSISKNINNKLSSQLTKFKKKLWTNDQYPKENVWKFRGFLIAFPRMIWRVRFLTYSVNAMLLLILNRRLSSPKIKALALKVIVKLEKRKDASEILRGKKKLKTTDLVRRVFYHITLFLLMGAFPYITDFYGRNVKNFGPKNPLDY